MGFLSSLLKKEKRSFQVIESDKDLLEVLGIDVDSVDNNKLGEVTYLTCMRILSDTISKLPLKLMKVDIDGATKSVNHYLYNLLKLRPNEYMSSSDFFKAVEFQRNHYGNAVVYIDLDSRGRVKSLFPLDMSKVKIIIDKDKTFKNNNKLWYKVTDVLGDDLILKPEQVLHFKGLTFNGIEGVSIGSQLSTLIENSKAGEKYINKYFKSGLFAKGVVQYASDISFENVKKITEKIREISGGVDNAGGVLPLPLGFKFESLSSSMADSQFLEINELSARQIAAAFGIKMHQLNDLDRSTHTNIVEQQKSFYIETLQSILTMYEQELAFKLLSKKEIIDKGYFFKFNVDSILRSDLEARYKSYRIGVSSGFLTPNEARKMEDLPLYEEGGDDLYVNGNVLKLRDAGFFYKEKYSKDKNGGDSDS